MGNLWQITSNDGSIAKGSKDPLAQSVFISLIISMILRPFIFLLFAAGSLSAEDLGRSAGEPHTLPAPDQEITEMKPVLKRLDDDRYLLHDIEINKRTREIRVPTRINMRIGLLEFAVVHINGKVHESLLHTEVSPTHLNIAFKLLHYAASRDLHDDPTSIKPSETPSEAQLAASRISLEMEWQQDGKTRRVPLNDLIQHVGHEKQMPPGPWVYDGSLIYQGKFVPQMTGDIAAIFLTGSALINYPGEDNHDDTVWHCYTSRIPPEGTRVTLIISPFQKPKTTDQP